MEKGAMPLNLQKDVLNDFVQGHTNHITQRCIISKSKRYIPDLLRAGLKAYI